MSNDQKIALVTGGSRGLGRNIAVNLARKGVGVVLTYHSNVVEADAAVKEITALGGTAAALRLDTGKVGAFDAFVAAFSTALQREWGRDSFDFLVNNAGIGINTPITETSEEMFDSLMNIHLKGVFFLTQKLLPVIADGGRIINISSGLTRFCGPGFSAYAMMKGGIEVFTRYLAMELGPRKITANTVAPGAIETDFAGGAVRDKEEYNRYVSGSTALGRAGLPDDIGPMVVSLLSEDNRWVNAQRIEVSGGQRL